MRKEPTGVTAAISRFVAAVLLIPMLFFDMGYILFKGHRNFWIMRLNQSATGLDIEKPLDEFFEKYANENYIEDSKKQHRV